MSTTSKAIFTDTDIQWMKRAISLADNGKGYVAPNPLVGCVIVSKEGAKIGEGFHERFGEAHAEVNALKSVTETADLVDATVYVTLEPCSHHGKTPPCAIALSKTTVKRVVIAMVDPNPAVNGKGIEILRRAGKQVDTGLLQEEAEQLNEFFIYFQKYHKPFITLKIAQTLDGYIAAPSGESRWITGKEARTRVHQWRSEYDAVMIGRNTALLDNPRLTVRQVEGRQPYRIVIDGNLSLPHELDLFTDQHEEKTIVITHNKEKAGESVDPMLKLLEPNYFRGLTILVSEVDGHSDLDQALGRLAELPITSILVEAGSRLASSMIKNNLVDKLQLFVAPKLLGGGTRSVLGLGIERMDELITFRKTCWEPVGNDLLFTGYF